MLNMNVYGKRKELSLFRFGFDVVFGGLAINRYTGGEIRGKACFLSLLSPGTGHFPFTVFSLDFLTGEKTQTRRGDYLNANKRTSKSQHRKPHHPEK